jgi:hypothetical protein
VQKRAEAISALQAADEKLNSLAAYARPSAEDGLTLSLSSRHAEAEILTREIQDDVPPSSRVVAEVE